MQIISTIGSLSGKLGGAVGSHGRIGQQLVARRPRTQPRTTSQQVNRSKLPALASAWRQLTRAQQAGWAALASQTDSHDRLGQAHHPSAYTLFLSCNRNLQSIGASDILPQAHSMAGPAAAIRLLGLTATGVLFIYVVIRWSA